MAGTGVLMWIASGPGALPAWLVELARTVHAYEAVLAALAVLVWHVYAVHLSPRQFPGATSWITGRVTAEYMRREHPVEYAALRPDQTDAPDRELNTGPEKCAVET